MVRESYEFICLCFGLGPAPRIFTKLMKIPISILRRINISVLIYLDDMLIMGQTLEEIQMSRDTVMFLLQNLGFVINLRKSVFSSYAGDGIFGSENKFSNNDILESCESENKMPELVRKSNHIDFRVDKIDRVINLNNSVSITSKAAVPLSSITTNQVFEKAIVLSTSGYIERELKNGVNLVDQEHRNFKWTPYNSTSCTSINSDICLKKGLGGGLRGNLNWGSLDSQRTFFTFTFILFI